MKRTELLAAMEIVRPGLAGKETVEQSTSFAFMDDAVVTYNDEISIRCPIEGVPFKGAVQADQLYKFLNKITKDEITIEVSDATGKSELKIKAGRSRAGLLLQHEIVLPVAEIGNISEWQPIPDNLISAMRFCSFSCSTNSSMPILNCVHVDRENGCVCASDGNRLTKVDIENIPVKSFSIPHSSTKDLFKYYITEIAEGEGWIHFKTKENAIFSCRTFEEPYPPITDIFKFEGQSLTFPESISDITSRALVFSDKDGGTFGYISISCSNGKMLIKSRGFHGWFEEKIKFEHEGEAFEFHINPQFLKEIFNKGGFDCTLSENRIKFTGQGWEHVIALVIVSE